MPLVITLFLHTLPFHHYDHLVVCCDIFQKGQHFINETIGRIKTSIDAVGCVAETDLVIEAIVENLDVKKKLFASLDSAAPQ